MSTKCAICLDEINMCEPNVCRTKCSHIFHVSCIVKNTIKYNNKCPMCRSTIYEDIQEENANIPNEPLHQFIDNKLDDIDDEILWHARKLITNKIRIYYIELNIIQFASYILQHMIDRMEADTCSLYYIALNAENWNLLEKITTLSNNPSYFNSDIDESLRYEAAESSIRLLYSSFAVNIVELNKYT